MCMEDYRIERSLQVKATKLLPPSTEIDMPARAGRVGIYVWCDATDILTVSMLGSGDAMTIWVSTAQQTSRFFTMRELGQALLGAFIFSTGGVGSAAVVETWLDKQ